MVSFKMFAVSKPTTASNHPKFFLTNQTISCICIDAKVDWHQSLFWGGFMKLRFLALPVLAAFLAL